MSFNSILYFSSGTKYLKNQPFDVIKMREMRGEVGKKTSKKRWIITYFYDVTWLIFETPCSVTTYNSSYRHNKPNQFGIIIYHQISNPWITGYVTSQKCFYITFYALCICCARPTLGMRSRKKENYGFVPLGNHTQSIIQN